MKTKDIPDETVVTAALLRQIYTIITPPSLIPVPTTDAILEAMMLPVPFKLVKSAITRASRKGLIDTSVRDWLATPTANGIALLDAIPDKSEQLKKMLQIIRSTPE